MSKNKEKRPKVAFNPPGRTPRVGETPPGRSARVEKSPDDANDKNPVWSIATFDLGGPWGRSPCDKDASLWLEVFPKMKDFESMTWGEILKHIKRHHYCDVAGMCKKAKDRLEEIGLDDYERLFHFGLSGTQRVWGIREQQVFRILWWDPEHEVYPSNKKHT